MSGIQSRSCCCAEPLGLLLLLLGLPLSARRGPLDGGAVWALPAAAVASTDCTARQNVRAAASVLLRAGRDAGVHLPRWSQLRAMVVRVLARERAS